MLTFIYSLNHHGTQWSTYMTSKRKKYQKYQDSSQSSAENQCIDFLGWITSAGQCSKVKLSFKTPLNTVSLVTMSIKKWLWAKMEKIANGKWSERNECGNRLKWIIGPTCNNTYLMTQKAAYLFVKLCFLCAFGEKNVAITESNFHCCKAESIGVLF